MRTAWMLPLACLAMIGCAEKSAFVGQVNTVKSNDLAVSVEVSGNTFYVGQRFTVTVTARNLTDRPLEITARRGAPVYIHLSRFTGEFEEEFRTYPEAALMVMSQWRLGPRETKTFPLDLVVGPEWPRGEALHLAAEINGRPDVRPMVVIDIASKPPPAATTQAAAPVKGAPADKPAPKPSPTPAPTPTPAPSPKPTPPAVMPVAPTPPPATKPAVTGFSPAGAIRLKPYQPTPLTMPAGEGPAAGPK